MSRMFIARRALAACLGLCLSHAACGGVVIGATRVIVQEERREATVPVRNADDAPYVVQAWIDDARQADGKTPFFVTPPLSRLDPGKENLLRVMRVRDGLPRDRESLLRLNVKEIPAMPQQDNVLQIAVQTRLKLFYRPRGLTGAAADAPAALRWRIEPDADGATLVVNNPTPYHVTFARLGFETGAELDLEMAPPLQETRFPLAGPPPARPATLTFSTINDYGAASPPVTVEPGFDDAG